MISSVGAGCSFCISLARDSLERHSESRSSLWPSTCHPFALKVAQSSELESATCTSNSANPRAGPTCSCVAIQHDRLTCFAHAHRASTSDDPAMYPDTRITTRKLPGPVMYATTSDSCNSLQISFASRAVLKPDHDLRLVFVRSRSRSIRTQA